MHPHHKEGQHCVPLHGKPKREVHSLPEELHALAKHVSVGRGVGTMAGRLRSFSDFRLKWVPGAGTALRLSALNHAPEVSPSHGGGGNKRQAGEGAERLKEAGSSGTLTACSGCPVRRRPHWCPLLCPRCRYGPAPCRDKEKGAQRAACQSWTAPIAPGGEGPGQ